MLSRNCESERPDEHLSDFLANLFLCITDYGGAFFPLGVTIAVLVSNYDYLRILEGNTREYVQVTTDHYTECGYSTYGTL